MKTFFFLIGFAVALCFAVLNNRPKPKFADETFVRTEIPIFAKCRGLVMYSVRVRNTFIYATLLNCPQPIGMTTFNFYEHELEAENEEN